MQTYKKYLHRELKIAINYCLLNIRRYALSGAILLMVVIRHKEDSSH